MGISGSGKTTLAKMMVIFFDPSQGGISLGGVNLNQIDKKALHQYINYLPQQPYVFNGAILENLLLGSQEGRLKRISYGQSVGRDSERISSACH